MRTLALAFLLCLASSIVDAQVFQTRKPIICDKVKTVVEALDENYQEVPIWTGKDASDETRYSLFINKQTKSWTFIQFTSEIACILGTGQDSKEIFDFQT